LAETGPDGFADLRFSQVAKNCSGIMNLISERNAKNVFIGSFEMCDIRLLSFIPVSFSLACGSVRKAVRTRRYHPSNAIAEPIANILESSLTALILNAVVKKSCDR
jgi:hypothetical protein